MKLIIITNGNIYSWKGGKPNNSGWNNSNDGMVTVASSPEISTMS